ncbi:zinc ribbon domain-containing protein [Agromyces archimandritae]|uniref:C4-type zinc ribbon domain-containing protein n=1 Tax=Agromyces archimandritae TaxID=2781962 RepID=A0A975FMG4_9MICO|nr:C4-type zinc ribbon domain-containing protein [Agromyces archimandritae]QTX04825.1 hypothetical protein G127AT_00675 [Agromyces archimandritae]
MKATPAEQQDLLRLQAVDTRLQQLAHRLGALPQTARIAELDAEDAGIRRTRVESLGTLEDARTELARVESDVQVVEARIQRDVDRLQATSSVKDVQALEAELVSLRNRLAELEEAELIVMQRVEDAERVVAGQDAERARIAESKAGQEQERDAAAGDLAVERGQAERDRTAVAGTVPAELLALYGRKRVAGGGVGAALLQQRACGGCTMTLTGTDLDAVRRAPADEVLFCPECDRILVRTDESGL